MRPHRTQVLIVAVALLAVSCTTSSTGPEATTPTSSTTASAAPATVSSTMTQTTTTSPATTLSPTTTTTTTTAVTTSTSSTTSTSTTTTSTTKTPPDTTPPRLEVTYPTHGTIVTKDVITFRGVTEPGARVFSGRYAADVNADGGWSLVLVLAPGDNGAAITARDAAGNATTERLTVTLNRCADRTSAVIPESADRLSSVTGDLDGNGIDDTITAYYNDADHTSWVHMALDYGYAASVLIEDAGWYPEATSTVTFAGSDALALVKIGGGAATARFGLFALIGCDAVYATSDPDDHAWFFVGSSMTYAYGTTCTPEGMVQRSSGIVDDTVDWENALWDITDDEFRYAPDRGHFEHTSSTTTQLTWSEIQEQDISLCHFDCPGVRPYC